MAPPNSSSFSVRVVLPASGWLMMAKVRLRPISADKLSVDIAHIFQLGTALESDQGLRSTCGAGRPHGQHGIRSPGRSRDLLAAYPAIQHAGPVYDGRRGNHNDRV